jgi:Stress responsive A/B Barrel Domain
VITHVVLFTFHDTSVREEAGRRLEALPAQIPELRSLTVGLDALGDPGAADLVLITTHDDVAGLRAYQEHPAHQDFGAWLQPLLAARSAVDVES